MPENSEHFLLICETCQGSDSADALRTAIADKLPSCFAIRGVSCMAGCSHPTTVGFQAADKAQYLFGRISSAQDIEALAAFAWQYQDSADGWTNATDRPPALYTKTLSRMPRILSGGQP